MLRFLSRLFHRQTEHVTSAAALLGVASLLSRVIGLFRDRLLAAHFGAGSTLDVYYAAFRWPDALYNLLIVGALAAGFIPVFSECLEHEGDEAAARLAGRVLSLTACTMMGVSLVLILGAGLIVPATVSGFSPAQIAETVVLTRIMALSPLLLGLSAVMGGVLQATKRFAAFAIAPMLYNVGIIFGIVCLAPAWGVRGVAVGVVLGTALHLLAQAIPVFRTRTLILDRPTYREPRIRRMLSLMGPRTAGLAITQLNLIVLLALASSLSDGSVSVLAFANNVQSVPLGLVGISFAVAALPALSQAAARRDTGETTRLVTTIARQVLVLVIPMAAWLILLRAQVVRLLLGQGAFDWDDTIRTAMLVGWFAISLPAQALVPLLARVWYAYQNAWVPFGVGVIAEIINVSAALILRHWYGANGLAIAFSLASIVQVIGLAWFLRHRGLLERAPLWPGGWKVWVALVLSLGSGYVVRQIVGTVFPLHVAWQVLLQGGASGLMCGIVYGVTAHLLRLEEWQAIVHVFTTRLWSKFKRESIDATESSASSM
jgi:putative peptidoglycan lipid II flippase